MLQEQIEELSTFNKDRVRIFSSDTIEWLMLMLWPYHGQLHRDRICVVQPLYEFVVGSRVTRGAAAAAGMVLDDESSKGFRRFLLPPAQYRGNTRRGRRRQSLLQQQILAQQVSQSDKTQATSAPEPTLSTTDGNNVADTSQAVPPIDSERIESSSSESSSESEDDAFVDSYSDAKETFVLEIDDETDEDLMSVLLEQELPEVLKFSHYRAHELHPNLCFVLIQGIYMCNTDRLPGDFVAGENIHLVVSMKQVEWDDDRMRDTRLNELLSMVFKELFARYCLLYVVRCVVRDCSLLSFCSNSLLFKVRSYAPCAICGLKTRTAVASETMVHSTELRNLMTGIFSHSLLLRPNSLKSFSSAWLFWKG